MAYLCASSGTDTEKRFIAASSGAEVIVAQQSKETASPRVTTLRSNLEGSTVAAMAVSCSGQLLAVCTSDKHLVVWRCEGWSVLGKRTVPKRVTVVRFTRDDDYLITADKTGEVTRYRVSDFSGEGEELLGHLSMLLDMVLTSGDSHVITCDRDEKIRVSRYPNCYDIETFCLGHTEFVSCLCLCAKWPHILLSASGDGTLRSWNWKEGKELDSYHCSEGEVPAAITQIVCSTHMDVPLIVASLEQSSELMTFALSSEGRLTLLPARISLATCPWSCAFDWSDQLWVCLPYDQDPVQCWKYKDEMFHKLSCPLSEALNKWEYFKDCTDERDWTALRKHTYDNMSSYLARKERRVQEKRRKQTSPGLEEEEDFSEKKMKLDDD